MSAHDRILPPEADSEDPGHSGTPRGGEDTGHRGTPRGGEDPGSPGGPLDAEGHGPGGATPDGIPAFSGGDATAMAHFYRGEMNRLTVWRTRMDATTNWAIISTVGLLSFSFQNPLADAVFIVNLAALWFLLTVESRRYRFYDVWRWRLRILEVHLLVPIVCRKERWLQGPWREDLTADLLYPTFKISMREAMGRRLLRNYIYLFGLVLVVGLAHILGISLATSSWYLLTREHLAASVGENWLLLCIIVVTYAPLLALAVFGWRRRKVAVELHDPEVRRSYRV